MHHNDTPFILGLPTISVQLFYSNIMNISINV